MKIKIELIRIDLRATFLYIYKKNSGYNVYWNFERYERTNE